MKVKCLSNTGITLPEEYLSIGWTKESEMKLIEGKEYDVYGITSSQCLVDYLVYDETEKPFWYPAPLFQIVENILPSKWHCSHVTHPKLYLPQLIIGYKEMVEDVHHYEKLVNLQQEAWSIFFKRKKEMDEEFKVDED